MAIFTSLVFLLCSWHCAAGIAVTPAYARFTHLADSQAISPFATSMLQDKQGFLWLGTHHGLYRFDGVTLQHYPADSTKADRLSSGWITSLLMDSDGILWVGTRYGGLNRFNPSTEQFSRFNWPDADNSEITALVEDNNGTLWVASYGGGVATLAKGAGQLKRFLPELLVDFRYINHLSVRDNRLYLALGEAPQRRPGNEVSGLVRVDLASSTVTHWHSRNSNLPVDHITRLHWMPSSELSLTTFGGGIWLLQQDDILQAFTAPAELNQSQLTDILTDSFGELWVSSFDRGVWHFQPDTGKWRHFWHEGLLRDGLQSNAIFSMFQDQAESIWFISHTGFSQLSAFARQIQVLPAAPDNDLLLTSNDVFGIDAVAPDQIWLANRESGLARFNPHSGELQKWPLPRSDMPGAEPTLARAVKKVADEIWLGTDQGLFRLLPDNSWTLLRLPLQRQPHISAIYIDQQQRTWLASRTDGVFVLDNRFRLLKHLHLNSNGQALPFNSITVLYEDQLGDIWLGSVDQGLARVSANLDSVERWQQNMPTGTGLVYNGVQAIIEENGHLFVRAGNLQHRVLRSSKQPRQITGIKAYQQHDDVDQELKQATAFNLMYRFIWSDANQGFIQLGARHGVQEATWIASSAVAFGNVYRGGRQGLDIYPLQLAQRQFPTPQLVLHQLSMFNQPVQPGLNMVLPQPLSQTTQLIFNHLQDMFSLHFTAPDFLQPQLLQYRYRLEGFDRDWLAVHDNNRVATYTRLPPGQYSFLLSARYQGGDWQQPQSLQISVLPSWWMTLGFRFMLGIVLVGTVTVVIVWRFANERQLRVRLEREVAARTEEIKQQHQALQDSYAELKKAQQQLVIQEKMASLGALVAGVAHEINTPLGICVTAASHLQAELDSITSQYAKGGMQKSAFDRFLQRVTDGVRILQSNTGRAADLVNSFKQISVDQSYDSVRNIELISYIHDVLLSLQPQLKKRVCQVKLDAPEQLQMYTDAGALAQIITNLVMNSLHHGLQDVAQPQIVISLQQQQQQLLLQYSDNGCGMSATDLARLFDPFFTTKRHQGGTGLGSHIVYNLVTVRFNGRIEVSSPPGMGLQYTIWLPLRMTKD
ncbi:sensor histidine kinase [Rheinheimera maricola]|uniref:histidine kinase n=1 Tax=Rheinheimera maricola TaxID=2793282 RepID=A0ABS7XCF6_9GAMM|nr:sensor histidine kinase [Rheinheimera maricola]MBZ9613240.1 hypothetical protein [Rheinheimera maricola]